MGAARRLEELRVCHDAISAKQAELLNAAARDDLPAMQALNAEIRALSEVASECVRLILASANGADV